MKHGYIAIILWSVLFMASGCGNDDSQAKLQACVDETGKLQSENSSLQGQLRDLQNELENLSKRKDVIYTVKMVVDFSGLQGPVTPAGGPAMSFLTEAQLTSRDGKTYRLVGRNPPDSPSQSVPRLIFEPIDTSQWTALRITALRQLQTLTFDFPAAFNAAGISWGDTPHFHAQFEVNGTPIADLDANIDPSAAKAGQPISWNVDKLFEHVSEEYTKQLNKRAG